MSRVGINWDIVRPSPFLLPSLISAFSNFDLFATAHSHVNFTSFTLIIEALEVECKSVLEFTLIALILHNTLQNTSAH